MASIINEICFIHFASYALFNLEIQKWVVFENIIYGKCAITLEESAMSKRIILCLNLGFLNVITLDFCAFLSRTMFFVRFFSNGIFNL